MAHVSGQGSQTERPFNTSKFPSVGTLSRSAPYVKGHPVAYSSRTAGEVLILSAGNMPQPTSSPMSMQSTAAATIQFTLLNTDQIDDPDLDLDIYWSAPVSLAPGDIKPAPVVFFAAAKITFTEPGTVMFLGR